MFKIIEAYQTSDGTIFDTERKAKEHQQDIIGQLLDDFLPQDDRGNITRADRYNILMKQLNDVELKNKINRLYNALNFNNVE